MKKVLILDDDHDIASGVKMILDRHGYASIFITDYKLLDTTLSTYEPEVLLLDISLGGADGRELCKQIKKSKYGDGLSVLLFSANMYVSKNYKDYGADAFIPKPFEYRTLMNTIEAVLAHS